MRRVACPAAPPAVAPVHIVCLPGAYHGSADLIGAGFGACVRGRGLNIDLSFIDVEMRHLGDRPLESLREFVVKPARADGCRDLWMMGISLGGFIALEYAAANPGEVDGLCLLAPYLGNRLLTREVAAAASLETWQPDARGDADEERRVWRFLQSRCAQGSPPALHLGFGCNDRFADAHRLLAAALPAGNVMEIQGGHDWPTWALLWDRFLGTRFT